MYITFDIVFSMSYTIFASGIGFLTINVYLFIQERKEKSFIKNAFGQYLSPKVIEQLMDDPSHLSLGGQRREMTAFFSDVQGFSTISESLTPDELVQLLNEYLTEMCNIIAAHDGTIDKFEGDAIIAFWGAPLVQPDHAVLSCLACIDMQNRLVELRKRWAEEGKPQLLVRMGVNSGPMVVGNMGSQTRMDYTIMGDSVNLAARLEGANKFYKIFTMISEFTYVLAKDFVEVRELDTIRVVGKSEPITVYELLDRKGMVTGERASVMATYHKGLELYKQRLYKEALTVFESVLAISPADGPSATYIIRCKEFMATPPGDDWDGVYTHTKKG
jgi:adenylate cyclase